MWRPDDWEGYIVEELLSRYEGEIDYDIGANAMLRALEPLIREIAPSSKLIDILYKKDNG